MTFFGKLLGAIGMTTGEPPAQEAQPPSFSLKEMPDGRLRYMTIATNNYEDRSGEVFPASAHDEFIAWAEKNDGYPELWPWHMAGQRLGVADVMAFDGNFLLSSGLIDPGMEAKAKAWADDPETAMSHGFLKRQVGSDIVQYRSFEQSVLPRWAAANQWTDFTLGAKDMALTPQKMAEFAAKGYTAQELAQLDSYTEQVRTRLAAAGIAFKDVTDEPGTSETPVAPVAPAATEVPAATETPVVGPLTIDDIRMAVREEFSSLVTAQNNEIARIDAAVKSFGTNADEYFAGLWASKGRAPSSLPSRSPETVVEAGSKESMAAASAGPGWINGLPMWEHPIFNNGRS